MNSYLFFAFLFVLGPFLSSADRTSEKPVNGDENTAIIGNIAEKVDIKGAVDVSVLRQLQNTSLFAKLGDKRAYLNSFVLELDQVYPYRNETESYGDVFFSASTGLLNKQGDFSFDSVPLDLSSNASYYVIKSSSKFFNLSPNRILVSVDNSNTSNIVYQANFIGKDYFPTLDILYPDSLPVMNDLTIKLVPQTPIREYIIHRNNNIFKTGFLGSIFESKWKTACLTTAIFMMLFPYIIEYLDPEAAAEMKARKKRGGRK